MKFPWPAAPTEDAGLLAAVEELPDDAPAALPELLAGGGALAALDPPEPLVLLALPVPLAPPAEEPAVAAPPVPEFGAAVGAAPPELPAAPGAAGAVIAEPPPPAEPGAVLGCMAEEPVVGAPDAEAAGRSVPPEGGAGWARTGAATRAVATRQAAMCFFSMMFSWELWRDRGRALPQGSTPS